MFNYYTHKLVFSKLTFFNNIKCTMVKTMEQYIISHKNPDTDSIVSAIIYSKYLSKKGEDFIPVALGELNKETKFVLEKFNFSSPKIIEKILPDTKIILVDHNELNQSVQGVGFAKIIEIIDHHKFDLKTGEPLKIRAEPIGSTCSIIAKKLFENNYELSKEESGMLISGIISDTLFFRSPTTTQEDKDIITRLNKIANITDLESYSNEMFTAKSDLGDISAHDLVRLDYKMFRFNDRNYGIGVMETTNPSYALKRKDEIVKAMKDIKESDNLEGTFFSVVDIINENNKTFYISDKDKKILMDVFKGIEFEENILDIGNILSRKKEMVPRLEKFL
jgi:manganese-dependent inorganic pyrophosphatase